MDRHLKERRTRIRRPKTEDPRDRWLGKIVEVLRYIGLFWLSNRPVQTL
ncbi:MAG: hypothetical protein GY847_18230 [Proteobacteria bacterium]|nr:hypothetical protein [Pseudomonadota bacterium]